MKNISHSYFMMFILVLLLSGKIKWQERPLQADLDRYALASDQQRRFWYYEPGRKHDKTGTASFFFFFIIFFVCVTLLRVIVNP